MERPLHSRGNGTALPDRRPDPGIAPSIEARLQLAAIVDSSQDAILSKDLDGIIISWNAAATRIFGYQPEEVIGRSILTIFPPDRLSEAADILQRVKSGERIEHFETRLRGKDGSLLDLSLTVSPIKDASGRIVGISKIARDITERKRTEEALIQSQRLAAIGRMAATIAHEVNNPLEAILNLAYLISENPSLDEEAHSYSRTLLDEVVRVSEITKQTLSFYRDSSTPGDLQVAEIVESVLKLHRPLMEPKSIRVVTELDRSARTSARGGELRQVFTNLVMNAVDALPPSGVITVRVAHVPRQDAVCVTIADNGAGVAEDVREKIFEPFFSTKQAKGNGLGLWVSQSIVRKYGGTMRMRTFTAPTQQTGTVFRVYLPRKA